MGYLKERIKHAVRFRHKRGYGVHSPFMFNLILNVIRDREHRFSYPMEMERARLLRRSEYKVFRLLSRLIRHLRARRVVCLGGNASLLAEYLAGVYREAMITDSPDALSSADFIYLGRRALSEHPAFFATLDALCRPVPDGSPAFSRNAASPGGTGGYAPRYLVVRDIYKDARHARLWRLLCDRATVSVDMMWYGLLFFDPKIQRGKYKLII